MLIKHFVPNMIYVRLIIETIDILFSTIRPKYQLFGG